MLFLATVLTNKMVILMIHVSHGNTIKLTLHVHVDIDITLHVHVDICDALVMNTDQLGYSAPH